MCRPLDCLTTSTAVMIADQQSVENFVPGKLASLGLSYEKLSVLNPRLIYASISGYGDTGPYANRGGYDAIAVRHSYSAGSWRIGSHNRSALEIMCLWQYSAGQSSVVTDIF